MERKATKKGPKMFGFVIGATIVMFAISMMEDGVIDEPAMEF